MPSPIFRKTLTLGKDTIKTIVEAEVKDVFYSHYLSVSGALSDKITNQVVAAIEKRQEALKSGEIDG